MSRNFNALMLARNSNNDNTPLKINSDGNLNINDIKLVGSHLNLYNNISAVNGTASNSINIEFQRDIAIFGSSDATVDIKLQCSADDSNWFDTDKVIQAVNGNFYLQSVCPAKFVRLESQGTATLNASLMAK